MAGDDDFLALGDSVEQRRQGGTGLGGPWRHRHVHDCTTQALAGRQTTTDNRQPPRRMASIGGVAMSFLEWPVFRQLRSGDILGRGPAVTPPRTRAITPRTVTADRVVQSVCPFCAVGCGQKVYVKDERVVQIEGDPDSPISRGRLCPKGSSSEQLVNNPLRQNEILYRAPRAKEWQRPGARHGDRHDRRPVPRGAAPRLAGLRRPGSAVAPHHGHRLARRRHPGQRRELPDQEALHGRRRDPDREPGPYLTLRHGSQSGSLLRARRRDAVTAGHGQLRTASCSWAATWPRRTPWDSSGSLRPRPAVRASSTSIRGSPAPRRSRTSTSRSGSGSDVVLLGGLINYVLTHDRWFKEYVVAYTNAATLVSPEFRDTEDLGGLFSGFDPHTGKYDPSTWAYDTGTATPSSGPTSADDPEHHTGEPMEGTGPAPTAGHIPRDETLQNPRTVFQILKRHFSRYTPEMVEQMCGISVAEFEYLATLDRRQLRAGADHLLRLRHRLDAAHARRAVHPHRGDPAAAAGQRRPARQRDHGAARARQHPGLHRHPDAVQPAARGTCRCRRWAGTTPSATTSTRSRPRSRRASGPTPRTTRSACSRRGGATPRRPRTTGPTTICRG